MKILWPLLVGGILIMLPKRGWTIPDKGLPFKKDFTFAETNYNIPRNLLARVAYQESRFRDDIISGELVSSAGAQGIMQIIPRYHPTAQPLIPSRAIEYAGFYLKKLYTRFGSWDKALAAYNWGPTILSKTIKKYGDDWFEKIPSMTRTYVTQILRDIPQAA